MSKYMVWQSNETPKKMDICTEVKWALERFANKYGRPTHVDVHPSVVKEVKANFPDISVDADDLIFSKSIINVYGEFNVKEEL